MGMAGNGDFAFRLPITPVGDVRNSLAILKDINARGGEGLLSWMSMGINDR